MGLYPMLFGGAQLLHEHPAWWAPLPQNWKLPEGPSLLCLASIIPELNPMLRFSALNEISCSHSGSQLGTV